MLAYWRAFVLACTNAFLPAAGSNTCVQHARMQTYLYACVSTARAREVMPLRVLTLMCSARAHILVDAEQLPDVNVM